jgi:hypothetical protein
MPAVLSPGVWNAPDEPRWTVALASACTGVSQRRKKMKKWLIRGLGLLLQLIVPALVEQLIVVAFAL